MEMLLLALSPFVVALVTQGVKKLETIDLSDSRKAWIRVAAAVLSFGAAVLGGWATGEPLDPQIITTFVETVMVFIGSQLVYIVGKNAGKL